MQERTQLALVAKAEAERLAESLLLRNRQLELLNSVSVKLNQSLNLHEILEHALDEVLALAHFDTGAVFLREDGLGRLELVARPRSIEGGCPVHRASGAP